MPTVSVIIPSRNEPYLQQTVNDVLSKATGDVEVIVVLDGGDDKLSWKDHWPLTIIRHRIPQGTRKSVNDAVSVATGDYIMKLDAHCLLSLGFDEILVADHQPSWVVTLPRYSLNPDSWTTGYGPVGYEYIEYPFRPGSPIGGLTPKKWCGEEGNSSRLHPSNYYWMENQRQHADIDEIQTMNGACWFMLRDFYHHIEGLDERLWNFHNDAVEIGMKAWLSGGKLMVNKHAYHGHWWKSSKKRTVPLNRDAMRSTQAYQTWYWMTDQWPRAIHPFSWFIQHFWPIPTWPANWQDAVADFSQPPLLEADP